MALFQQKKPQIGHSIPLYSLGQNKSILIVGLGNIGKEYDGTRHNIGFDIVDRFVRDTGLPGWVDKKDLKCQLSSGQVGDTKVFVIKPTTFMNLSGEAVRSVADFFKINFENVIVIHDELDIPFGQLRMRIGGGAAGHNGIKSVSQHISEHYGRLRVGIGPKVHESQDSSDFVLARFSKEQQEQLPNLTREAVAVLSEYVYGGELQAETRNFIV
jgi:PTH1 family peptidyl-tRNA hydrolase